MYNQDIFFRHPFEIINAFVKRVPICSEIGRKPQLTAKRIQQFQLGCNVFGHDNNASVAFSLERVYKFLHHVVHSNT